MVEREVRIAASPETVFGFFCDPELKLRWMGVQAELDPVPGGIYRVRINARDVARGEYVEVVPHERIVFTWGWEGDGNAVPPGASTVEVTLTPDGEDTCCASCTATCRPRRFRRTTTAGSTTSSASRSR